MTPLSVIRNDEIGEFTVERIKKYNFGRTKREGKTLSRDNFRTSKILRRKMTKNLIIKKILNRGGQSNTRSARIPGNGGRYPPFVLHALL